jgi:4-hydroxy-L-threonine phosphate dehydrogenase PdxA
MKMKGYAILIFIIDLNAHSGEGGGLLGAEEMADTKSTVAP